MHHARLARKEQPCIDRRGEHSTRIRMAGHGMRIGASRVWIAPPGGRSDRMQALADATTEKGRELTDCKVRERRFAFGFEFAGKPAAGIDFDQRASERPHVIAAGLDAIKGAVEVRVLGKFLGLVEPEIELVGKAEGQHRSRFDLIR